MLRVTVEDNGPGFSQPDIEKYNTDDQPTAHSESGRHIGLMNIKRTLELQYGRSDLFRIGNHEPHGATVCISFPIRNAE